MFARPFPIQVRLIKLKRLVLRPVLLGALGLFIMIQVLVFSPSTLEEETSAPEAVNPETLSLEDQTIFVPEVPKQRVPEHTIEGFQYASIQNGEKLWKIEANKAFMYTQERLVHAQKISTEIFDPEGKITWVRGAEARYFLNKKDLEVFGEVKTVFPDGFEMLSDYLQYKPGEKKIFIPSQYRVEGQGREGDDKVFHFVSYGLDYDMANAKIVLSKNAVVTLLKHSKTQQNLIPGTPPGTPNSPNPHPLTDEAPGVPESTRIESDQCFIDRKEQLAYFTMFPSTPLKSRFIKITQPDLIVKARKATLNYGNFNKVLQYLVAQEDVVIKEIIKEADLDLHQKKPLRYATGGRAIFDTHRDYILLDILPQAYQDGDTVTGDSIIMHRDSDIIEVEHSNAFSQGSS